MEDLKKALFISKFVKSKLPRLDTLLCLSILSTENRNYELSLECLSIAHKEAKA
jgi:hypothetical protein